MKLRVGTKPRFKTGIGQGQAAVNQAARTLDSLAVTKGRYRQAGLPREKATEMAWAEAANTRERSQ
ncbi:MAG: hypothetical protein Tsb0016_18600 [Sphingomonadales bacterium]